MADLPHSDHEFESRIDGALGWPARELVAAYFDPAGLFAADTFDTIGANDPARIGIDDLLAVNLLDVRVMPKAIRALLGNESDEASRLLTAVPVDVPLWEATSQQLEAATEVWKFLKNQPSIDWVTAGKLLARKRPLLIPIYDSVIKRALEPHGPFWCALASSLRSAERRAAIDDLRPAGLTPKVSTLRLLDVAIWMRHSEGRSARAARRSVGSGVAEMPGR